MARKRICFVTLPLKVMTGSLRATRRLVMTINCLKQYLNSTINNTVMARKRIQNRRTDGQWGDYYFGEHKKQLHS